MSKSGSDDELKAMTQLSELAFESILREYPESSEGLRRSLVYHLIREGIPALRKLESESVRFATDASHGIYGALFHVYYHVYNSMVLTLTLESVGGDVAHDIGVSLNHLEVGDVESAVAILKRIKEQLEGDSQSPPFPP